LQKRFGSQVALAGVSFALRKGEWLALLGPNGAGKTTTVRAVAGRVRPDGGEISLLGERLGGATNGSARTRLGVVPQEIALYPLLTARENLAVFGELNGVAGPALQDRIDWALEWTGLADRSREPVKRFSGGMMRRLNIACGVLHQPEVILLDEPTVGVDPQSRERIWQMCDQLRRAGAALLLTTHQLDEAQQMCDRIVIVDHGRVIADGTLDQLIARTIGPGRRVTLRLRGGAGPAAFAGDAWTAAGDTLSGSCRDVAAELPVLLGRIHAGGGQIEDLRIETPSLHAVFLHLTGRELRE
jgi:ABC-2 type transport system ATP-binding protein